MTANPRIALHLPEGLKARIETEAARRGLAVSELIRRYCARGLKEAKRER